MHFLRVCVTLVSLCAVAVISVQAQDNAPKSNANASAAAKSKPRARDLGIPFDGTPGPLNAITDVAGVEVGHTTLISGEGKLAGRQRPRSHRRHRRTSSRQRIDEQFRVLRMVVAQWQRGNDRHDLARRIGVSRRPCDDHQHAQRRRSTRRGDSMARVAWSARCERLLVVAARCRGNVGRLAQRHQRFSREAGARISRTRYRYVWAGAGRFSRRRHRNDL